MKKKQQILLWLTGAIMVGAGVLITLRPRPVEVEVATIGEGELVTAISAEGRTRVRDRFIVAAPVTGRLRRIELHRGDKVKVDQAVALIDPVPLNPLDPRQSGVAEARLAAAEAAQREAEALISREQASLNQARRELRRGELLVESGDLPRQELERISSNATAGEQLLIAAQARSRITAAEVEAARSALRSLSTEIGPNPTTAALSVRSPVAGSVLRLLEESERVVSAGTPLIEISNPSTLELVIEVLSSDAVRVSPGAEVIVERWGGDHVLHGSVRMIEPSAFTRTSALGIEEQRVNIIADLVERPENLGDGYRIETRIVIARIERTLKVPLSSLFRQNEGQNEAWMVFAIERSRAQPRLVTIGNRSESDAQVLAGLTVGTPVILFPPSDLQPGARVTGKKR
ncbi:MAG: HlyD family efflux transporter periplasmic adaptor subunit [Acidobacteria bacterium]|nr:HlyD family efflux transporter periplasmic adaptor subunit [Acidobacteriota bacterium]